MEMHSRQSLYAVHGISVRTRTQSHWRWMMSLFATLPRLTSSVKAELRARRAAAELAEMDDRMLRDMGVSRYEIASAVRTTRSNGDAQLFSFVTRRRVKRPYAGIEPVRSEVRGELEGSR
jgi:uncharacterized protein YjiS (DUF1127 family)